LKGHYRSAQERFVAQTVPPQNSGFLGKRWNRGSRFSESTSDASGARDEMHDASDPILLESLAGFGGGFCRPGSPPDSATNPDPPRTILHNADSNTLARLPGFGPYLEPTPSATVDRGRPVDRRKSAILDLLGTH